MQSGRNQFRKNFARWPWLLDGPYTQPVRASLIALYVLCFLVVPKFFKHELFYTGEERFPLRDFVESPHNFQPNSKITIPGVIEIDHAFFPLSPMVKMLGLFAGFSLWGLLVLVYMVRVVGML